MTASIRELLGKLWESEISDDFAHGLIVSESTLTAAFYHHIRLALAAFDDAFTVYTVPTLWWMEHSSDRTHCWPDLLVGEMRNGRGRAAAIVELKFQPYPRGNPQFKKDMKKLENLSRSTKALGARIDPASGEEFNSEDHHFRVDENTQLVYAAVAPSGRDCLDRQLVLDHLNPADGQLRFGHFTGTVTPGVTTFSAGEAHG